MCIAALNIDVLAQEAAEGTPQTECMYDCLSGGDRRGGKGGGSRSAINFGAQFGTQISDKERQGTQREQQKSWFAKVLIWEPKMTPFLKGSGIEIEAFVYGSISEAAEILTFIEFFNNVC